MVLGNNPKNSRLTEDCRSVREVQPEAVLDLYLRNGFARIHWLSVSTNSIFSTTGRNIVDLRALLLYLRRLFVLPPPFVT